MLETLAISGYRSIRELTVPLQELNLITGANGSGKSSLYRALRLLAEAAQGGVIGSLAREGGFDSTLWAGPESVSAAVRSGRHPVQGTVRQAPVALKLGFAGERFSYAIDLGLPPPDRRPASERSAFAEDPQIKSESIWSGVVPRPSSMLVQRRNNFVQNRSDDGEWRVLSSEVPAFESMFSWCADPQRAPELLALRETIRSWRFYDHFRTDAGAPARQAQIGTYTPVLGHDGADLAAALQTIREIGDVEALDAAIDDAFPGSSIHIGVSGRRFELRVQQPGLLRPLVATELSDGTLRYLLLVAALLTPRPPQLLVLNEPETSLHPDLLPALGRLIRQAAQHSQIIVVSHASRLVSTLEEDPGCNSLHLVKEHGETRILGASMLDSARWRWPER